MKEEIDGIDPLVTSMIGPQWTIGDVSITRVAEVALSVDPLHLLPSSSEEELVRHGWMRPWAIDDAGDLQLSVHSLCIEAPGLRVVVDTCFGLGPLPESMAHRCNDGSFLDALTQIGFGRDDVDVVICTHMHVDHVGWNTMPEMGAHVPTFRKARYLLSRPDFEFWRAKSERERSASAVVMYEASIGTLLDHGVAELVEPDTIVSDEIQLVATPGHTPGHMSVLVRSQGTQAFITGDCVHSPVQFAEPEWFAGIDVDRETSSSTRRRLLQEFTDTDVLIIGTHFPPPTAGRLVTRDHGVVFEPFEVHANVDPSVDTRSSG